MLELAARAGLSLVAGLALALAGCGKEEGVACDPCGRGVPLVQLFEGVPSTCGRGLECVAATVFLPGPGVCVNTNASTTCPGTVTDSSGTRHNQCTYTPVMGGYDVTCR